MRYCSSRLFVVGLLLVVSAVVAMPLFVTGETVVSADPAGTSWDTMRPTTYDFRIPVLMGGSGVTLMLATVVQILRKNRRR